MADLKFPKPAADARTVVVTGGGRGIGRACALEAAQRGCKVGVLSRSLEEIDEVASLIHHAGGEASSAVCNVADGESVARALELCHARLGPVDIIVNNAGQAHSAPFQKLQLADWQRMLDVNLTGTFLVTQAVLPAMIERGFGRVINIASTAGLTGFRYTAHYCAAKHGVVGMTRALALETARTGVTVNAVCPGWVDTDMLAATVDNIAQKTEKSDEEARKILLGRIPTRRFVTPERVAALVGFLSSENAGDITGAVVTMDGGETAGPP